VSHHGPTLSRYAIEHRRLTRGVMILSTLALIALALLPTLAPQAFPFLQPLVVDTDPENMLEADEPIRRFHDRSKERFALHDAVVVGVVDDSGEAGVFTPQTLGRVKQLTDFALELPGVVASEVMAPSTIDSIEHESAGSVRFDWLMPQAPADDAAALALRERALRIPFLRGTLFSEDAKALALYIPLTAKREAHGVSVALQQKIAELGAGPERYHIAGLPVAEDTFGVEMFVQMAISAPLAMAVIFGLMFLFFRSLVVVAAPMIVAMVAALSTMGLLIATGHTVHIMSSMIPIFIMPIAVLDAVHIISEFFDRYRPGCDRRELVISLMDQLHVPMLFTSLTTCAGFASLSLTPIPPVQVFGVFVAVGVLLAWFWTVTYIPAYLMGISEERLQRFGMQARRTADDGAADDGLLSRLGRLTAQKAPLILLVTLALAGLSAYGIGKIVINDNPTKWFESDHPIRVADRTMNHHFGGTYDAYLSLRHDAPSYEAGRLARQLGSAAGARATAVGRAFEQLAAELPSIEGIDQLAWLDAVDARVRSLRKQAASTDAIAAWDAAADVIGQGIVEAEARVDAVAATAAEPTAGFEHQAATTALAGQLRTRAQVLQQQLATIGPLATEVAKTQPAQAEAFFTALERRVREATASDVVEPLLRLLSSQAQAGQVFKEPAMLAYLEQLQRFAAEVESVGKSNSVADIVKTVHRDLLSGDEADYRIPHSRAVVAQSLEQYLSSHRKDDLWHFVTPSYDEAMLWLQLRSGDNRDMERVAAAIENYIAEHPPPAPLQQPKFFGLTYINVIWQQKMVSGMANALAGSFAVVLLMMVVLFRSVLWGVLSMVPLTVTVGLIYGVLGLLGKDYDMPVAVLSSLSLGLAIDYAIHFLARSRRLHETYGSWDEARPHVFGEPARAIARNVMVVGVGFLPLLLAPLVPYQTVGMLIAAILIAAGAASLLILPASIQLLQKPLFGRRDAAVNQPEPSAVNARIQG